MIKTTRVVSVNFCQICTILLTQASVWNTQGWQNWENNLFTFRENGISAWGIHSDVIRDLRMHVQSLSRVRLFATPWTAARQVPPFMGFPRQVYWNMYHFLLQGIFRIQGSNLYLLYWQVGSLTTEAPGKPYLCNKCVTDHSRTCRENQPNETFEVY